MSGRASRDKGARTERAVVALFQEHGLAAERIPLSGAAGGSFRGDVTCPILGDDERFEVKCRADGFKQLYDWLDEHYGLVVKADRKPSLVVLRLEDFATLAITADTKRVEPSSISANKLVRTA